MGRHAFASGSTSMAMGYEASAMVTLLLLWGERYLLQGPLPQLVIMRLQLMAAWLQVVKKNDASDDRTTASAKGAVAIGKNTKVTSEDAVAIGTNAEATRLKSVALGSGSTTATGATNQGSTTINGITYNFAGATGNPNMQFLQVVLAQHDK